MNLIAKERRRAPTESRIEVVTRRSPFARVQRQAGVLRDRARLRARGEIDRRRTDAATTLETLAQALRPHDAAVGGKARRTALALAGGSGLALTAALGIGVAMGMLLSARRKKRADERTPSAGEEAPPIPAALAHEPVV